MFENLDSNEIQLICNQKTLYGTTILHLATENKQSGVEILLYLKEILKDQSQLFFQNGDNGQLTCYHHAARFGNLEIIKGLFKDIGKHEIIFFSELKSLYGTTLLHLGAENKECGAEILLYLKEELGDQFHPLLHYGDKSELTCYHHAALFGNLEIIKVLFDDFDKNNLNSICKLKTLDGGTILHVMARNNEFGAEILAYFQKRLEDIEFVLLHEEDNNKLACFHHATLFGNLAFIETVFGKLNEERLKAICKLKTLQGGTILHLIPQNKGFGAELIEYFKNRLGHKLLSLWQQEDNNKLTCYHHATLFGNIAFIMALFNDLSEHQLESICELQTSKGHNLAYYSAK